MTPYSFANGKPDSRGTPKNRALISLLLGQYFAKRFTGGSVALSSSVSISAKSWRRASFRDIGSAAGPRKGAVADQVIAQLTSEPGFVLTDLVKRTVMDISVPSRRAPSDPTNIYETHPYFA